MARTALFESWRGLYADSPRAISEALAERYPAYRRAWVAQEGLQLPSGCRRVRRHSADYFRTLVSAHLLVTNDIVSKHLVKSPRSTYVQTWHGTPLKLIGHDEIRHSYPGARAHLRRLERDVPMWDYLVSPSPTCTELFRSAFRYDGPVLEVGYPRNDVLRSPQAQLLREATRRELGLSPGALAVLYLPTWRDDVRDASGRLVMPPLLDEIELRALAPAGTVLLTRKHRNIATATDTSTGNQTSTGFTVDVSRHPDVAALYLAADVLVSDYSSAVYDFAVTGKPVLLLAPDLQPYADQVRGFYFDYHQWAPGPILESTAELADSLHRLDAVSGHYRDRYTQFVRAFCPYEDGRATERLLDALHERLVG